MTNATDKLKARLIEKIEEDYEKKFGETEEKEHKSIEEQKKEKKFVFQFIDHENGKRSEPFVGSWDTVQEVLAARKEGERPNEKDYVLLVAVLDGKDTTIPGTPLITVKTFESYKG